MGHTNRLACKRFLRSKDVEPQQLRHSTHWASGPLDLILQGFSYVITIHEQCLDPLLLSQKHKGVISEDDQSHLFGELCIYSVGKCFLPLHSAAVLEHFQPSTLF